MSDDRKENREAAQQKFRNACRDAGLNDVQRQQFSRYMHDKGLLEDYMSYQDIRKHAEDWLRNH